MGITPFNSSMFKRSTTEFLTVSVVLSGSTASGVKAIDQP
jgi:hypothetical protein